MKTKPLSKAGWKFVTRGSKLAEYVELIEWRSLTDRIFSAPENADLKSVNWLYDVFKHC